jgi:hypothetical protein
MKMVMVHHEDAKEPILVPECNLAELAEKGWHPAKQAEKPIVETVIETVDSIDSEEVE